MKIFTICDGSVQEGAGVTIQKLSSGIEIPVVAVGEKGRGRNFGFLPVQLLPFERAAFNEGKPVTLRHCSLGKTKSGGDKIISETGSFDRETCLLVDKTTPGYRGSVRQTSDKILSKDDLANRVNEEYPPENYVDLDRQKRWNAERVEELWEKGYENCGANEQDRFWHALNTLQILCEGEVAQGDAGRMGSGTQYIGVLCKNTVYHTTRYGRLYGAESDHYYYFSGYDLLVATWKERIATDIF